MTARAAITPSAFICFSFTKMFPEFLINILNIKVSRFKNVLEQFSEEIHESNG